MRKIVISILLLLIFPLACRGAFDIVQWQYIKEINASSVKDGLVDVALDDEIFSGANKNLSDVRVVDAGGKEVSFKIVSGTQAGQRVDYAVKILNNSFVPGQSSSAILDLGEKGKLTNSLTVATTSENFQRNVKVSGSDDMNNWNVLRDNAYVYDYTDRKGNLKTQNVSVSFPASTFRYLKLEISDENNNPVKINAVTVSQYVAEKNQEVERHPQFSANENTQNQSTEIVADLGLSGIPTNRLLLQSKGVNFNRGVLIFSSNDKNNWKTLGQGYVFRYNTPKFSGENLQLNFAETNDRYLKIEVLNKDNTPLVFQALATFSIYREIIFQKEKEQNYRIFYGNAKASYPEYDLEKYFQYLDVNSAQKVTLAAQKDNPAYIPAEKPVLPISERIPYLFSTVLVLFALILLFLVARFLKEKNK